MGKQFDSEEWSVEVLLAEDAEKVGLENLISEIPEKRMAMRNAARSNDGKETISTGKAKPIRKTNSTEAPTEEQLNRLSPSIREGLEANIAKFAAIKESNAAADESIYKKMVMDVEKCKSVFVNGTWYIIRDIGHHESNPKCFAQTTGDEISAWRSASIRMGILPVKAIIAGSRTILDRSVVEAAIKKSGVSISEVVCGEAKGPDTLGKEWAIQNNIPCKSFPADWDNIDAPGAVVKINKFGNPYNTKAGFLRNQQMLDYAAPDGILIAVYDGLSVGTLDMIERAEKVGLEVYVHIHNTNGDTQS